MRETIRFKWLLDLRSGDSVTNESLTDDDTKYPVYGGGKLIGYYDQYNTEKSILIGRVGANCGSILKINGRAWATDNALIVNPHININYLYYLLQSAELNNINTSNAQPLITAGNVLKHSVHYTNNLAEQTAIADFLDTQCTKIDALIGTEEKMIEELQEYRKSVIHKIINRGGHGVTRSNNGDSQTTTPRNSAYSAVNKKRLGRILSLEYGNSIINQLITIKNNKITQLKEYKKSLIYEYVTGKREVVK